MPRPPEPPSSRSRTRCSSRPSGSEPRRDRSRRRVGLGRIRAVLRLGERADGGAPRRAVLGAVSRRAQPPPVLELGCGTGRIALPIVKSGTPLVGIDRSEPMLERARRRLRRAKLDRSRAPRPRRHSRPAVPAPGRIRLRHGAVRRAAVADPRTGPQGDAGVGGRGAPEGRAVRARPGARPAALGRVFAPDQPARRARARHPDADRIRPPGTARAG